MSTVQSTVDAGICGFVTGISAESEDQQMVTFRIESPCANIQHLAGLLGTVDAYAELGAGFDGEVHSAARQSLKGCCSGCVVPVSIFKAMQVAARVALPKDVSIVFRLEG